MLEVRALSAGYGGTDLLRGLSFAADPGRITAVLGPNGCGKSTLLRAIGGILPASSGQVLLDGEDLLSLPPALRARQITYLPQNRQAPDIPVGRLVLYGRFPYLGYPRRYRPEDHRAARQAMEALDILPLADTPMNRLSGGQQQKAYIAMAMAQDTPAVLLDEPTTYLDVAHQLQVMALARQLADSGRHVIMVIHDLSHAMDTADRILLMQQGSIVSRGTPEAVFASGKMDVVFGVSVKRVPLGNRWHYFCSENSQSRE